MNLSTFALLGGVALASLAAHAHGGRDDVRTRLAASFKTCAVALAGPRGILDQRRIERLIGLNAVEGTKLRREYSAGATVIDVLYEGQRHWRSTMRSVRVRTSGAPTVADEIAFENIGEVLRSRWGVRLFRSPAPARPGQPAPPREHLLGLGERRPITEREAQRLFHALILATAEALPNAIVHDYLTLRTLEDLEDTF